MPDPRNNPAEAFHAATIYGEVRVWFPAEPEGEAVQQHNIYDGPLEAIDDLHRVMRQCCDSDGMAIEPENAHPHDFYYFCQPAGSGITITWSERELEQQARDDAEVIREFAP